MLKTMTQPMSSTKTLDYPPGTGQRDVQSAKGECNKKYFKIQDGLESSISQDGKARIRNVLNDIQRLTDVEKLLLYLKLPTGVMPEDPTRMTPPSCLPTTSNRGEQACCVTWIKSHLEEHGDVCMPKAEVYEEYRLYCEHHELRPLCNADFGKMMKHVFPDINTRRLGQRGQSKYFYGGLRQKKDHTPPTLSEMEVHTKSIEIDSSLINNELYKASCHLICEWSDKLLDSRFSTIQSLAEHLVTNLYVNTKSVAAFTLIAAMQENGNQNLKGSALYNSHTASGGDKHKETNLLLQQKLHKNKILQKQKEKLQAMKDEGQQQQQQQLQSVDGQTPTKKSTTPSRQTKTMKIPTSPSPRLLTSPRKTEVLQHTMPLPSPKKIQSKNVNVQNPKPDGVFVQPSSRLGTHKFEIEKSKVTDNKIEDKSKTVNIATELNRSKVENINKTENVDSQAKTKQENIEIFNKTSENKGLPLPQNKTHLTVNEGMGQTVIQTGELLTNQIQESLKLTNQIEISMESTNQNSSANLNKAETPCREMEIDCDSTNHVRKIIFDEILEKYETCPSADVNSHLKNQSYQQKSKADETKMSNKTSKSLDDFSKSDGHISLRMLLEKKQEDPSALNKSIGFLEKSKNTLFVNQSNVSSRSAFVPFSQVQARKEQSNVNQVTSSTTFPILIPSGSQSQSDVFTFNSMSQPGNITMIAVPTSIPTSQLTFTPTSQRLPDNIIKILPANINTTMQPLASSQIESQKGQSKPQPVKTTFVSGDCPGHNVSSMSTETLTVAMVTPTTSATSTSCDSVVTSAQISSSSQVTRQVKPRFAPIRPKATAKPLVVREPKVYDKRPVSTILKEKRAKEQITEAAKLHTNITLPQIPYQTGISINRSIGSLHATSTVGTLQATSSVGNLHPSPSVVSNIPPKEVVIIVNPSAAGAMINQGTFLSSTVFKAESASKGKPLKTVEKGSKLNTKQGLTSKTVCDLTLGEQNVFIENKGNVKKGEDSNPTNEIEIEQREATPVLEERDVTPILQERDITPILEMDVDEDNIEAQLQLKTSTIEQSYIDHIEAVWSETPAKMAKLASVTSPFRPESACSLRSETPIKVTKTSESCSSRPDSACSYGRETPSGARKRKSSDFQPRRDFKRLNSTGDDMDDTNFKEISGILSPECLNSLIPRRTQSCTFELDKEAVKHVKQPAKPAHKLLEGLQSPDISSLEREALIESFPNSLYAFRPQKYDRKSQKNSVGINARSLRQEKLIKQSEDLDERMKNLFPKSTLESPDNPENPFLELFESSMVPESSAQVEDDNIVKDSAGKVNHTNTNKEDMFLSYKINIKTSSLPRDFKSTGHIEQNDIEPSGLPSDVADWITESLEKRQNENQSVMSEPDLSLLKPRPTSLSTIPTQNFNFQVSQDVKKTYRFKSTNKSQNETKTSPMEIDAIVAQKEIQKISDNTFMVPKVPTFSSRGKDGVVRSSSDAAQRCQSLPTFTSPVQSPVSSNLHMGRRVPYLRATSMSPRAQHVDNIDKPPDSVSPIRSRIEVRDNHPISVNIHPVAKHHPPVHQVGDGTIKNGTFVTKTHVYPDDSRSPAGGAYLKTIQHTLQMPRETPVDPLLEHKPRDGGNEMIKYQNTPPSSGATSGRPISRESSVDRNWAQTADTVAARTPFTDSGYHSTGPSPVLNLNSTPISSEDSSQMNSQVIYQQTVAGSPFTSSNTQHKDYCSPIPQLSPHQSPCQLTMMGPPQNPPGSVPRIRYDSGVYTSPLSSTTNSAFIPIQGSHDVRYVTPIKPIVTLPNSGNSNIAISGMSGISNNLFIDQSDVTFSGNHGVSNERYTVDSSQIVNQEIMMPQDPPSYETAIMSLRKPDMNLNIDIKNTINRNQMFNIEMASPENDKNRMLNIDMTSPENDKNRTQMPNIKMTSPGLSKNDLNIHESISTNRALQERQNSYEIGNSRSTGTYLPSNPSMQERVSLLAKMGQNMESPQNFASLGPFTAKLVELSEQSKQIPTQKQTNEVAVSNLGNFEGNFNLTGSSNYNRDADNHKRPLTVTDMFQGETITNQPYLNANQSGQFISNIQTDFLQSDGAISSNLHNEQSQQQQQPMGMEYLQNPAHLHSLAQSNISNKQISLPSDQSSDFDGQNEPMLSEMSENIGIKNEGIDLTEALQLVQPKLLHEPDKDLGDDIHYPWESLQELEGYQHTMGDFDMFED